MFGLKSCGTFTQWSLNSSRSSLPPSPFLTILSLPAKYPAEFPTSQVSCLFFVAQTALLRNILIHTGLLLFSLSFLIFAHLRSCLREQRANWEGMWLIAAKEILRSHMCYFQPKAEKKKRCVILFLHLVLCGLWRAPVSHGIARSSWDLPRSGSLSDSVKQHSPIHDDLVT